MCYLVLVLLVAIAVVVAADNRPHDASRGLALTIFFIYLVYALMPLRIHLAIIGGVVMSVQNIAFTLGFQHGQGYLWKQV